jgi:hypothetical protein
VSGPPSPSPSRPPSPPPSPRPKSHSSVGLNTTSSAPSYVDVGTSTMECWYYPTQTIVHPIHETPVLPPPPYRSSESLYGYGPLTFEAPTCGLTYSSNQAVDRSVTSGHSHAHCVTIPTVVYTACCQSSVLQGYPSLEGLHI